MDELVKSIEELEQRIEKAFELLKLGNSKKEIVKLEKLTLAPEFWKDQEAAKETNQRLNDLKEEVEVWEKLKKEVGDILDLAKLDQKDKEVSLREEIEKKYNELLVQFRKLEFFVLFSGPHDRANAILSIHAGTGGTEAQDWAEMLLRMYFRFCEKKGWKTEIIDETRGSEAGIKSITVRVTGRMAYGWLRSESGVHRLVRISPFDAEKMRHTSFALVEVLPEIDDVSEIKLDSKDLRIDTYLSSGHGGQSVQTTYSAVRVVHLPTGLTVSCQRERSQAQNKETALKILKAKILHLQEETRTKEIDKLRAGVLAAWGNQIRSYVLQPYRMVKDHRTKLETADTDAVLNGDLEQFMEAYLKWKKEQNNK
ncbi:MAG: peptide chain release factor 2 [Patescibacteria group bacterium]